MNKKQWDKPEIFNIGIEETQAGGHQVTTHDGNIYQLDSGVYVEEYAS